MDVEVPAGESKEVDIRLPTGGTIEFYCRFHKGQGMRGAFILPAS